MNTGTQIFRNNNFAAYIKKCMTAIDKKSNSIDLCAITADRKTLANMATLGCQT